MYYTYLLRLSNGNYYVGSTGDLKSRVKKHQTRSVPHTSKFRPIKVVWFASFANKKLSVDFEKYLKSSSGKVFRNKHLVNKY